MICPPPAGIVFTAAVSRIFPLLEKNEDYSGEQKNVLRESGLSTYDICRNLCIPSPQRKEKPTAAGYDHGYVIACQFPDCFGTIKKWDCRRRKKHNLQSLKKDMPLPQKETVTKVCIDDFSIRKRHAYGTVMVDIESRRVIDLLP